MSPTKTTAKKTATKKRSKKALGRPSPGDKAPAKKPTRKKRATNSASSDSRGTAQPKLLSGGNPQIPKGDGDEPVEAYITAMPGWKSAVGRQLDALVERTVPGLRKAVRWNSPFYGVEGRGWFLSYHCFNKYLKLTFLNGSKLRPPPPVDSKHPDVRYYHIYEDDAFDEAQLADWFTQAAALPGEEMF